jgi:hypothetical protein
VTLMFERIPYTNAHIYAYALAFILAAAGFTLDYLQLTVIEGWFARGGALISICSILFLSFTIKKLSVLETAIQEYSDLLKDSIIFNHNSSHSAMELKMSPDVFSRQMDDAVQKSIKRTSADDVTHELRLLILGTFIWGFGDIPFTLLKLYG